MVLRNQKLHLSDGFDGINLNEIKIYNITDTNNQEVSDPYSLSVNGNNKQITIGFSSLPDQDVIIEYGIATYKLDRGYQRIGLDISDSVRKIPK
ncbi:hypothetical protein LCGC14_2947230 [marine sediment metagenome]|uniref:Uncharacterized protein n=1 Tax=marine sediment metagenome TaxID=412755 RepID=A0A0F8XG33_9ZZZZ